MTGFPTFSYISILKKVSISGTAYPFGPPPPPFPLFLRMVMYYNEFKAKESKIWTKDKIEPQQIH